VEEVLEAFRTFVADADVLVAYNGTTADFPMLEAAYDRAGLSGLDRLWLVDGYYLALALWPTPPRSHRLRQIAERVGIKVDRLVWHDALDDAKLLALLMSAGGRKVRAMDSALRRLVASATVDSKAWELVFDLAGTGDEPRAHSDTEVGRILGQVLAAKPRLRDAPAEPDLPQLVPPRPMPMMTVPGFLRGEDGGVDPFELACAVKGERGEPRPAQREMAAAMRGWIADGVSALVEAPTGTGKSYAMLAVAVDWLAANPAHRVVISTFTKQLQAQLAADIEALGRDETLPDLAATANLVKGKANRLSLRALVVALADCTAPVARRRPGAVRRTEFAGDVLYRELVAFLALRLAAPAGSLLVEWESRSIDQVDVPAFFENYCRGRRHLYLATLSQAAVGEYPPSGEEVTLHTADVSEVIATHRLIVANHALLLANLYDFGDLGANTLLIIDEAHALEDAATAALSPSLEYGSVEKLGSDLTDWLAGAPDHPLRGKLAAIGADLERFLDTHRFPNAAMAVFDTAAADATKGNLRKVSLASPYGGAIGLRSVDTLRQCLEQLTRQYLDPLRRVLGSYAASTALAGADRFEQERFWAVYTRAADAARTAGAILADTDAILGPLPRRRAPGGDGTTPGGEAAESAQPDGGTSDADVAEEDTPVAQADEAAHADEQDVNDSTTADRPPAPPPPNRAVWAEQRPSPDLSRNPRYYRFQLTTSPIELGAEPVWRAFLAAFART